MPDAPQEFESYAVNNFFHVGENPIDTSKENSLAEAINDWKAVLGPGRLPFAQDGGGNVFTLKVDDMANPVLITFHDDGHPERLLAPSFEKFLDNLHVDPDMM